MILWPSFAWLDLRNEPVVITVPKSEQWAVLFGNPRRPLYLQFRHDRHAVNKNTKGGNYLISGPSWKKPTPGGITMTYQCETQFALAIFRSQLWGDDDLAAVSAFQQAFQVRTLGEFPEKADSEYQSNRRNFRVMCGRGPRASISSDT